MIQLPSEFPNSYYPDAPVFVTDFRFNDNVVNAVQAVNNTFIPPDEYLQVQGMLGKAWEGVAKLRFALTKLQREVVKYEEFMEKFGEILGPEVYECHFGQAKVNQVRALELVENMKNKLDKLAALGFEF